MRRRTIDAARGKWRGILLHLGVEAKFLESRHGPCPMCGGEDRFRWDNAGGNGTYFCNQCRAGNGLQLLMNLHGWDFAKAAREVDRVLGAADPDPPKREMDDAARDRMRSKLWQSAVPLLPGDFAHRYLASRATLPTTMPSCLRWTERCPAPDRIDRPALLALVEGPDNEPVNIHRTFLGPHGKAEMDHPRALMPGPLPDGAAIRLFPVRGEILGIAEGIETALAAANRFGVPVWSAINAILLSKWMPPPQVAEVWVFGDNDAKYAGQAAAFSLAHRLAGRLGLRARVHVPRAIGCDWADEMAEPKDSGSDFRTVRVREPARGDGGASCDEADQ